MSRLLPRSAMVCLFALFPVSGHASPEGWTEVQEGVLQRNAGENQVQTYTFGRAGMRWAARRLAERISSLEREHAAYPSDELAGILTGLKRELARRQKTVQTGELSLASAASSAGEIESRTAELTAGCEPAVTTVAHAGPQSTRVPGVSASANLSFQGPCPGNTYTYAYSRATSGSVMAVQSREDTQNNGTSIASAVDVSASGSVDCFSEAYAMVWIEDRTYEATDTNYSCTAGPLDSTPYGLPLAVPGTIKAADFDNGGEGVAFHEATADTGSSYRTTQVDLFDDSVVRLGAGEWLQYTIDVKSAGAYTLVAEVGSDDTGAFHLELDGVDVTGPVAVPVTGNWSHWGSAVQGPIRFTAGRHTLRLVVDGGFDGLHSLRFVPAQAPFGGAPKTLPGTIKAVEFDEGGEQISYHDSTSACYGTCSYRRGDVDHYSQYIHRTAPGEWMEYTVNVTTAGTYTLSFRVGSNAAGGTFHVEADGVNVTGPIAMPNTGGWNTFQTVTRTGVSLKAGVQVLRLVIGGASYVDSGTFDTITIQ